MTGDKGQAAAWGQSHGSARRWDGRISRVTQGPAALGMLRCRAGHDADLGGWCGGPKPLTVLEGWSEAGAATPEDPWGCHPTGLKAGDAGALLELPARSSPQLNGNSRKYILSLLTKSLFVIIFLKNSYFASFAQLGPHLGDKVTAWSQHWSRVQALPPCPELFSPNSSAPRGH